jgi:hypothetical protein
MKMFMIVMAVVLAGMSAGAQEIFVYPAKGQTAEQVEKDKFECYQWAKQQSGFDPTQAVAAAPAQPPQTTPAATPPPVRAENGSKAPPEALPSARSLARLPTMTPVRERPPVLLPVRWWAA